MSEFQTPGVYVKEIATLPPSVAEVPTAIPAFFGYTEKGSGIARINTLLEFEERFGKAKAKAFTIEASQDATTKEPRTNIDHQVTHGPIFSVEVEIVDVANIIISRSDFVAEEIGDFA